MFFLLFYFIWMIQELEMQATTERLSSADKRVQTNLINSSLERFKKIMANYYKIQSEHRDNCKSRIQRQMEIAGKRITDEEIDRMLETGYSGLNTQIFTEEVEKSDSLIPRIHFLFFYYTILLC